MNQKKVAELRFLGYIGVQVTALLAPLLVFQLTHSAALAGIALLMEWGPKLVFYFMGGSIAHRFGLARTHIALDLVRIAALMLFTACALGFGTVWWVAAAAAMYQSSNALSNILFELSVTTHWQREEQPQGHALLMKRTMQGCLLALVVGLVVGDPLVLCLIAAASQVVSTLRGLMTIKTLYPARPGTAEAPLSFRHQLRRDLKVIRNRNILQFSLATMFLNVPVAIVFSALAFYLDRAQPGVVDGARTLALVLMSKAAIDVLALEWIQRRLKVLGGEQTLAAIGIACLLSGAILAALPLSLGPAVVAALAMGISFNLYQPWVRTYRQALLRREIPSHSHASATGILISVEATSRLIGAALLGVFGSDIGMALTIATALAMIGLFLQHKNIGLFQPKKPLEMAPTNA